MRAHLPMSRATPPMRNFARCLIAYETLENKSSSGTKPPAAFPVCEKLRLELATFMGKTGFHTLLSRSLALSADRAPIAIHYRALNFPPSQPLSVLAEYSILAIEAMSFVKLAHFRSLSPRILQIRFSASQPVGSMRER